MSGSAPVPLPTDNAYIGKLEKATPPNTTHKHHQLHQKYLYYHQQVIGEMLYPTMKFRPDIVVNTAKLSQYMESPSQVRYIALRHLCNYLEATIQEGI